MPRPESGPGAGEAGFSLLEVVIATVILMTVLVATSSLLQTDFKVGANSRYEQQATEIASSTLDNQLATGAATLLTEPGDTALPSVVSSGQTYLLEMEVAPYDPGTLGCVSPTSDTGAMLKVTVWATWSDEASGATWWIARSSAAAGLVVKETSLLAVPASAVNSTLGSLLVSVQNAANTGVPDISVTATPSSGGAQTAVTTSGGCVLFANVSTSVTWTVSFVSLSGYITEQETSLPTSDGPLSITADATTSVTFAPTSSPADGYDKEATVTPVYAVPMALGLHPILPSNVSSLPLSFYSTTLSTSPYVTTSPAEVFPVASTPSYSVAAGSCGAESDPSGVTLSTVNLSPGASASPTITLVPVQIYVNQGGNFVGGVSTPATVTASVSNAAGTGADTNCPASGANVMPTLSLGNTTTVWSAFRRGRRPPPDAFFVLTSTTTSISSSLNPSFSGQSVTFSAQVVHNSTVETTGTINFTADGTTITGCGSESLSTGTATCTTSALAVSGTAHTIVANYSGTGTLGTSSATLSGGQTVSATPTTTTSLSSSVNPSTFNTSITLTATVTAASHGPAVGNVAFMDGSTVLATQAVNGSGVATYTTSTLILGSHALSAVFTASTPGNFATSTGTLSQVVNAPAGSPYTLCGLPYGVWLLTATYTNGSNHYSSANETTQVVITINASGISINGAAAIAAPGPVVVYVK